MADKSRVLLALPHYSNRLDVRVIEAAYRHASRQPERFTITVERRGQSLLANGFNYLWADALRGEYDYFVMLHSDVEPRPGFVDVLVDELEAHEADMVSVVIPIKGPYGITSTGIGQIDDPWNLIRRFTMREVMRLPETFSAEETGYPGHPLAVNTGCWVADLRKDWCRAVDGNGCLRASFQIEDRIRVMDGEYVVECQPEDWRWSRKLWELGCKVLATRKVQMIHHGDGQYPNSQAWGNWDHDINALDKPPPVQEPVRVYPAGADPLNLPGDDREKVLERFPKNGVLAEVGVWKGDFSQRILDVCRPRKLYLIDPWESRPDLPGAIYGRKTQEEMDAIYRGVCERFGNGRAEQVEILRGSLAVAFANRYSDSLDGIYIDGCHQRLAVADDLYEAMIAVRRGGIIAGDDYQKADRWYGDQVKQAVDEFAERTGWTPEIIGNQYLFEVPS